ncbi:MAG: SUMF1/EgtB/PvdO family nonheme iron enzyme, partial [Planctomycetes bacterium]|nr:SUMF1/EgtB/PvdO family nonheme iron enzyme [Planctomycetota bacterium]
KFWIPSYDEWLKAVHYDPNKNGPGEEGYWLFPHSSDDLIVPGRPGEGETSAGWDNPNVWHVLLGSYPESTSPWGLLDASGGAREMIDTWVHPNGSRQEKFFDGAAAGDLGWDLKDRADMWAGSGSLHTSSIDIGFRIASSIPSPGAGILLVPAFTLFVRRRRSLALNSEPSAASQQPARRTPRIVNTGATLGACALSLALAPLATAQTRSYDFDFATITHPGNAAYDGGQFGLTAGIGRVDYVYRIAKLEITTDQWLEYANVFSPREGGRFFTSPAHWGANPDPSYTGPGRRWTLIPGQGQTPVAGISWQEAARYANWLHNDKSTDPSAIENGAYDTSTWGFDPLTGRRTDGNKLSDANFWIPSYDEWLKAVHYDPNKNGPGQEGYWLFPHSSDDLIVPGLPGVGETSAGWIDPLSPWVEWQIPLGAYPESISPWGLLDASGGVREMIDTWVHPNGSRQEKFLDGAAAGDLGWDLKDRADVWGGSRPLHTSHPHVGFRIASSVPSPGTGILLVLALTLFVRRRRSFT